MGGGNKVRKKRSSERAEGSDKDSVGKRWLKRKRKRKRQLCDLSVSL